MPLVLLVGGLVTAQGIAKVFSRWSPRDCNYNSAFTAFALHPFAGLARPRTRSLATWLWAWPLARSRPARPAAPSACPSTTRCEQGLGVGRVWCASWHVCNRCGPFHKPTPIIWLSVLDWGSCCSLAMHFTCHPTLPLNLPTPVLPCHPQLLRIEEELGDAAVYAGENYRHIAIA